MSITNFIENVSDQKCKDEAGEHFECSTIRMN